jgi:AraC-like DNA-binding protein
VVERFLRARHPRVDDAMILARRIAACIVEERSITRVAQLVEEFGINQRALQRLFRSYVGVGPKWVIQRYRLLEAADRVATGRVISWADLSLELGYADQAHFIREFKKLVGLSPADYARRLGKPRG